MNSSCFLAVKMEYWVSFVLLLVGMLTRMTLFWATIIEAVEFLGEGQLGKELREKYTVN